MAYLVDTDILIDFLRQKDGVANYLDGLRDWSLSIVTGMELVAGALDKKKVREIDIILATYQAVPVSAEVGQFAYNIMKTNILGVRPDYIVEIRKDVLDEHDGPMLHHGLKIRVCTFR